MHVLVQELVFVVYVLWNEKRGLRTEMATLQDVQKTYANGSISETPFSTHKAL